MKKQFYLIFFSLIIFCCWKLDASENTNPIIGTWVFQSMATTYYSDPQETDTVDKNDNYSETLIFTADGKFNYKGNSAGETDQGHGSWSVNENQLTTIIGSEKTIGKYTIIDENLTITTQEEETDQYFATKSVVVYQKK
tara:strand:- start:9579 stop:9995 length:417 start_codon:yes stop_codon:yes gene_type:complete